MHCDPPCNFLVKIIVTLLTSETNFSTQILTSNNHSLITAPLQSITYRVLPTDSMKILQHTNVASNFLSHFLNFAQNILPLRYNNVHHHSQFSQNTFHQLHTTH